MGEDATVKSQNGYDHIAQLVSRAGKVTKTLKVAWLSWTST